MTTKLTKEQINAIVLEEVQKAIDEGRIDEGIWDSLKAAAAKLGSLEKGGKILGRGKRDTAAKAQAEKSLDNIEQKAGEASKALISKLRGEFVKQGFPNQKNQFEFTDGVFEMEAFYDSIVKANKEGKMPAVVANEVIKDLRIIVKRFLDYDLADIYKHFKENKELSEQDQEPLDQEEGPIGTDKDSTTISGLKSNLMPMILAALGGTSLLADVFVKSDMFKKLATKAVTSKTPVKSLKSTIMKLGPNDGEGMTQMVARLSGDPLSPSSTMSDFFKAAKKIGITPGNLESIGTSLGADPGAYAGAAKQAGTATLQQVFGQDATFFLDKGSSATTSIVKTVTKTVAKTAVKSTVVGKIGATVGPFLAPLGIGLLASAAGVKALRVKGQKSSRAQMLNDLLQKLDLVKDDTTPDQKQLTGPTDSPPQLTQQDQLPAVIDTTTDLVSVSDPEVPEEEKQEIVQGLDLEKVEKALALAGVPDEKIQQILNNIRNRDTQSAAESVSDVKVDLENSASETLAKEAEDLKLPTSGQFSTLRTEFAELGLPRSLSVFLSRTFAYETLTKTPEEAGRAISEQEAEPATDKALSARGSELAKQIGKLEDESLKRLAVRFVVRSAYDFDRQGADEDDEKINLVKNVKTILASMNKNASIASVIKAVLTGNPDKLTADQISALRKAVARRSEEPVLSETRRRSSEERFNRLTRKLTKKRIL